jgi:hypothetical protein
LADEPVVAIHLAIQWGTSRVGESRRERERRREERKEEKVLLEEKRVRVERD